VDDTPLNTLFPLVLCSCTNVPVMVFPESDPLKPVFSVTVTDPPPLGVGPVPVLLVEKVMSLGLPVT
jgi:hypothetical protein